MFCMATCNNTKADDGRLFTSDELTSSSVNCVIQDKLGFIWVGTEDGLNKFDGYHFEHFYSKSNDSTTISDNTITTIHVDRKGQLWVGTGSGLSKFDYHNSKFTRHQFPGSLTPRVTAIAENEGGLLIGTAGYGLFCIRNGSDKVVSVTGMPKMTEEDYFSRIHVDQQGWIWRGSHKEGITRYLLDKDYKTIKKQKFHMPFGGTVCFLRKDKYTTLIVGLHGIMSFDIRTGKMDNPGYDLSALNDNVSIRNARFDNHGNLYICTAGNGVMKIARGTKLLTKAFNDNILSTANANALVVDKYENIWTTCYNKGLYKISNKKAPFSFWSLATQDIKSGSAMSSLTMGSDGNIWCTIQNNGLYVFNKQGELLEHPNSPMGTSLVYCDRQGRYWLCTENSIYSYNPATGLSTKLADLHGWGINCMADDMQGNLYVSIFGKGLWVYDMATGKSRTYSMNEQTNSDRFLWNDWIMGMKLDSSGTLWIGTAKGVSCYDTKKQEFKRFKDGCLLPNIYCNSLAEDQKGNIYIGTNAGLYKYSKHTGNIELVEPSAELEGRTIKSIVAENNDKIWLGTSNGIWLYDAKKQGMYSFIHGFGLKAREYRAGMALTTQEGNIVFGANEGLTVFSPAELNHSNIKLGEVFLTGFFINGKSCDCLQDRFTIPYEEKLFTMQFSLLDYRNTENITFEYRLNHNHSWTKVEEGSNSIVFNRMIPGKYQLEVRAVCNGVVSGKNKTITLVVENPWYATNTAYLIYILIAIAILATAFMVYRRHKREELEEAKMQFLINATHDIRSPLTLIIEPLTQLKKIVGNGEGHDYIDTISHNAQRLLLLVNQILDERKIDKKQMHLHCSETDIADFINRSMKSFKFRAERRNINLSLTSSQKGIMVWIDRIHFDKVIANLLSNAFKYTPDEGEITINVEKNDCCCIISVTDTGIGLKEEKTERLFERFYQSKNARNVSTAGTGIGLNLCRALVNLHGGTISAANRTDGRHGAVFTVSLPLGNAHLKPEEIETAEDAADLKTPQHRQPSHNIRVMVVDDDEEIAHYIKNELSAIYRFSLFRNGKEALKALLSNPSHYDIIISDVMMPEMDGISMLRAIKTNPNISDTPVILLTSKAEVADRLEGLKRGADAFLAKPFSLEELQIVIDNLVNRYRRIKGKYTNVQEQADNVTTPKVEGNDEMLMKRIMKSMNEHISDPDYNVEKMSEDVGVSRAQLHRKMKEMTGISTSEFIRNIRLEQAAKLIKEGKINITQIAYSVGFNNQTHFSTVFKKHYGMTPSEYAGSEKQIE